MIAGGCQRRALAGWDGSCDAGTSSTRATTLRCRNRGDGASWSGTCCSALTWSIPFLTATTTRDNDSLEASNEALQDNVAELRDENSELNETIAATESEIASLESEIAELRAASPPNSQPTDSPAAPTTYLNELEQVDGRSINTDAVTMLGNDYRNAITMDLGTCGIVYADFPLGNQYRRFTSTVG